MKKNVKLACIAVAVALSVIGLLSVVLTGGFRPSVETDGQTVLSATAPYDYDVDSIDRKLLHDKLSALIDAPFTVGVTANYSHGYPEILITSPEHFDVSTDEVKNILNETYPDLDIELVDHFNYTSRRSKGSYYVTALLTFAVIFLAAVMFFTVKRRPGYSLRWLAAAVLALCSSLLFEKLAGCREGNTVLLFSVMSLAATSAVVLNAVSGFGDMLSSNRRFTLSALICSAAVFAVCIAVCYIAGLTDLVNTVLTAAAAVIPSLAVSALVVPVLF